MSTVQIDTERSEAFAEELARGLNGAATTLMVSIGHRTGLFDTLSDAGPLTSEALAERAGLQGALRARVARRDDGRPHRPARPRQRDVLLPPEHAAWLTRAASPNNIAVTAQWISVLGQVEDDIVRSFREGGGVPYERFRRFHETMAEESDQTTLAGLFDHILPLVPGLVERLEDGIRRRRSRVRTGQARSSRSRSGSRTARSSASTSATMRSSGRAPGRPSSGSTT